MSIPKLATNAHFLHTLARLMMAQRWRFFCTQNELEKICQMLNDINWSELGFVCDVRFLFSQRSLENVVLGVEFEKFIYFKS